MAGLLTRGIRGRVAAVKWSYYTAAAVDGYAVSQVTRESWKVTGTFVPDKIDPFKLSQRPLFFVAPLKKGAWRWEIRELIRLDGGQRFTAQLGRITVEGPNGITYPTP